MKDHVSLKTGVMPFLCAQRKFSTIYTSIYWITNCVMKYKSHSWPQRMNWIEEILTWSYLHQSQLRISALCAGTASLQDPAFTSHTRSVPSPSNTDELQISSVRLKSSKKLRQLSYKFLVCTLCRILWTITVISRATCTQHEWTQGKTLREASLASPLCCTGHRFIQGNFSCHISFYLTFFSKHIISILE